MFSVVPVDVTGLSLRNREKQALRYGIIAELDAINLYEQLGEYNFKYRKDLQRVFLDIAKEEKEHVAKFLLQLLELDKEQAEMFGFKEVKCKFEGEKMVCKVTLKDGHQYQVEFEH